MPNPEPMLNVDAPELKLISPPYNKPVFNCSRYLSENTAPDASTSLLMTPEAIVPLTTDAVPRYHEVIIPEVSANVVKTPLAK